MSLMRAPGKTHRNNGRSRKQIVLFPRFEGGSRQKFIIADDDIGRLVSRAFHCFCQPDYRLCGDSQFAKEPRKMVAEKGVSGHAKRGNGGVFVVHATIVRGGPLWHKAESGTDLSHGGDAIVGQ